MTTFFDIMYAAHGQRCFKPLGRALLPTVNRRAPQTAEIRFLCTVHFSTWVCKATVHIYCWSKFFMYNTSQHPSMQSPLCTYTAEIRYLCPYTSAQEYTKPTVHIYCWNKFFIYSTSQHKSMQSPLCTYTAGKGFLCIAQVSTRVPLQSQMWKYTAEIRFLITVKVNTRVCKDHCAPIYCWNKIIKYSTSQHKSVCSRPTVHILYICTCTADFMCSTSIAQAYEEHCAHINHFWSKIFMYSTSHKILI